MKTERLKKLEAELKDLEQWLKLGLVPKREMEKHKQEIESLQSRIEEERDRLRFLKENGELEEYVTQRKPARATYQETPSMPDVDLGDRHPPVDEGGGGSIDDTEAIEVENSVIQEQDDDGDETTIADDDEDPFSDRNRWKRGILDPDDDSW